MEKTIDLGLTIAPMRGKQCSRINVTVIFGDNREKPEEGYFSVMGSLSKEDKELLLKGICARLPYAVE